VSFNGWEVGKKEENGVVKKACRPFNGKTHKILLLYFHLYSLSASF
jgi:hypothetical protein